MKSENIFYSIFIIIALLFWNPLSYHLYYSNTPIYDIQYLKMLYWIIFIGGLLMIILIQFNYATKSIKNISLVLAIIGIMFALLVSMDRFFGLLSKDDVKSKDAMWLIFEPYSKAKYKTFEFDYIAEINSLGLRDREFPIDKGNKFRILCFGDSWTYGYGVNLESSWPKLLEQNFINNGFMDIEVINCARPGQFTGTYKQYMSNIVPLLKPDLVLVGVLQLDDLAQVYTNDFIINNTGRINTIFRKGHSVILRFVKYSFYNILPPNRTIEVTKNWHKLNQSMINKFDRWQKLRFYTLEKSVQDYFWNGQIEPSLLNYYINYPDRILIFNNPENVKTKFAIDGMNTDIIEMNAICDENEAELIFINIPISQFTGHIVVRNPSDVLNDFFLKNNNIDLVYRNIAESNEIAYFELTDHFKNLPNKIDYHFKYDGHTNEKGNTEIANYLFDQLILGNHILNKN